MLNSLNVKPRWLPQRVSSTASTSTSSSTSGIPLVPISSYSSSSLSNRLLLPIQVSLSGYHRYRSTVSDSQYESPNILNHDIHHLKPGKVDTPAMSPPPPTTTTSSSLLMTNTSSYGVDTIATTNDHVSDAPIPHNELGPDHPSQIIIEVQNSPLSEPNSSPGISQTISRAFKNAMNPVTAQGEAAASSISLRKQGVQKMRGETT